VGPQAADSRRAVGSLYWAKQNVKALAGQSDDTPSIADDPGLTEDALKAIPRLADAPVDAMKPHVRRWHQIGLERDAIGTEPFDETWIDFLHVWPKVKFPKGSEPLLAILQRAKELPPPAVAAQYDGDGLRLLVALCRELQRTSGARPSYLSCRTAARLLGLDSENGYVKAWRWLDLLVHDHVIEIVEPGERGKRRATRYRYLAD